MTSAENMVKRIKNAEENFLATLMEIASINTTQARRVFEIYKNEKIIKLDPVGGRWIVKHGAFMDQAVILRAARE